jgi:rod shape determining protein RodA
MRALEIIRSWNWLLAASAILLVGISLAMLFSATYTTGSLWSGRFGRQLIAMGVSVIVFFFVARIPYHVWRRFGWVIYGGGVLTLLAVALTARVIRGAASRLTIFDFQLQPSEFMKIGVILMLALIFARRSTITWRLFLTSALVMAVPLILIALEPDLGVAGLFLAVWAATLFFLGLPWKAMGGLLIAGGIAALGAWKWLLIEYQKQRLLTFLDPTSDPLGAGYNVVQSIVALGSGGLFGRGLGHGPQSQLQFLPERHTDFILASIGEELGFIGVAGVIILYAILLWSILRTARLTRDRFGQLLCIGAYWILLVSFVVSAGMNMGLLPVTGIPLPLVSYGGSNLLATFIILGIVQSVRVHSKWTQAPPRELNYVS